MTNSLLRWPGASLAQGLTLLAFALVSEGAVAQESSGTAAKERLPAASVVAAQSREFLQRVAVSGTVLPRDEVLVFPAVGGHAIVELATEPGDLVSAGDVLARLDDRTLRSETARAEAALAQAEAGLSQAQSQGASAEASLSLADQTLSRVQALRERGLSTEAALQDAQAAQLIAESALQSARNAAGAAEAQVAQARAALELAQTNQASAQIVAPVSGVVSARNGLVGAMSSSAGEPIYKIIRDGIVEVEVEVLETDLARVVVGDPAELRIAGASNPVGAVRLISPTVDSRTRLGTIRVELEPADGLRPGLFAAGWITTERRQGLGVPAAAVIIDGAESFVLLAGEGGLLERRAVTPLLLWEGWVEVEGDLEPGDEVLARAGAFFTSGDTIIPIRENESVVESEPAAAEAGERTE